jgi:hypothetical protein
MSCLKLFAQSQVMKRFIDVFLQHFYDFIIYVKILILSWAPMAHACNPSYSGSRDQEDQGQSQPRQNS